MYETTGWLVFSGLVFPLLFLPFNRTTSMLMFWSIGMSLIFWGWLNFINFDGRHPWDQKWESSMPVDGQFDSMLLRLLYKKYIDGANIPNSAWEDYHMCVQHNVCVRLMTGHNRKP